MKIPTLTFLACAFAIGQAQTPPVASDTTPVCDPFIPKAACRVNVNFASGEHDIVAVQPGGVARIHLTNKPPLSSCQAAYVPGPLTRNQDSTIAGALATLGGIGAVGGGPAMATKADLIKRGYTLPPTPPGNFDAEKINAQIDAVKTEEAGIVLTLPKLRKPYQDQSTALNAFRQKTTEPTTQELEALKNALEVVVKGPIPSLASLQAELGAISSSLAAFHQRYDGACIPQSVCGAWLTGAQAAIDIAAGDIARDQDYISDIPAFWTTLNQTLAVLAAMQKKGPPFTEDDLPAIPKFFNSNVGVTITCKDVITQTPSPTNIAFIAYYTRLPILDLSAGPLFSLLGRREVGVVSQSAAQMAANIDPNGTFAVTDHSSFQVMLMAFLEIHTPGFHCPWYKLENRERRFGWVCSAGIALGAGPNNGSGTTEAEFFEGASFAIQRVSFLFGFHDGRVEEIGGGYAVGGAVPLTPAGFTPLITRGWSVRPAFGITYRIPIH